MSRWIYEARIHSHGAASSMICDMGHATAEFGARLQRLGSEGTAPVLASRLLSVLPGTSVPAGSPAVAGHLLATAVANMAQASFGPLQPFKGLPALHPLLNALEVTICSYFP